MKVTGIVWMGVRTGAYRQLRELFATTMGMPISRQSEGVAWFVLGGGEEIQIYDDSDVDHTFFADGPVVGFEVDDFGGALDDLAEAGVELIGDGDTDGERRWQHFRGPDGNIYEIIGPVRSDRGPPAGTQ